MHRCCFLLIAFCLAACWCSAQKYVMYGLVKDSSTHFAIGGAKIVNTTRKKNATADPNGFFRIEVVPNDLIRISSTDYKASLITYSILFADTITVFLSATGKTLPTVSVASSYTRYQFDSMNRKKEFEQNRGTRLSRVSRAEGFGIAVNLDRLFKSKYKYQRKNEKRFDEMEKAAYVAYRFSPNLVALYSGLKGQQLENFMNSHAPTYEWLRKHPSNEEVMYFINDQLKIFRAAAK